MWFLAGDFSRIVQRSRMTCVFLFMSALIMGAAVRRIQAKPEQSEKGKDAYGCGKSEMGVEERVINGRDISPGDWPWLVKITAPSGMFCSGSLISDQHVLTAGHCFVDGVENETYIFMGVEHIYPNGTFDGSTPDGTPTAQRLRVVRATIHPSYVHASRTGLDVAVVELEKSVNFNAYVKPVCLPERYTESAADVAFIVGWGYDSHLEDPPVSPRESYIPVNPSTLCDNHLHGFDAEHFICAGGKDRGTKKGDSGGPLLLSDSVDRFFLVGLTSAGVSTVDRKGHAFDYGMYTRVAAACDFVRHATADRAKCVKMSRSQ